MQKSAKERDVYLLCAKHLFPNKRIHAQFWRLANPEIWFFGTSIIAAFIFMAENLVVIHQHQAVEELVTNRVDFIQERL